jgi:antitoxin ChpS
LQVNAQVGLSVSEGRLIVDPHPRRRYTLEELMAQCDPSAPLTDEEQAWLDAEPVGREII